MGRVAHELDELLGGVDAGLVAVIEDTEAPDAAAQLRLAVLRGEAHEHDVVAGDGLLSAGASAVGVQLLGDVPAEGHLQDALIESGDLLAAVQRGVKGDALHALQLLQSLDVVGVVPQVLGVLGVGEGTAVEVVDEGAGALVAALASAEDSAHGAVELAGQSLNGLDEVLGGPGVVLQIHILESAGLLKGVLVDGHAVSGHNQRILIHSAVGVGAGLHDTLVDAVDLGQVGLVKHVLQVHHVAVGAPVGDQALGTLHNQVGGALGGDGGVHAVVAGGVVQILHLDGHAGLGGEGVGQLLDLVLILPVADGVGPQGDLRRAGGGGVTGSGLAAAGGLAASGLTARGRIAGGGSAASTGS